LLPVYNQERYLRDALASVLAQTFVDFELLLIDDGSSDGSAKIAEECTDPRLRLEFNDRNRGLPATLNRGLGLASGQYIARMDADDICLPHRLEEQVRFMDLHPQIGICGTAMRILGSDEVSLCPLEHEEIRCALLFYTALAHPTVMLRRDVFECLHLQYDVTARHAEDYDLWVRAVEVTEIANLPDVLLEWRVHAEQVSSLHQREQAQMAEVIIARQLAKLGMHSTPEKLALHRRLVGEVHSLSIQERLAARAWLDALERQNAVAGRYVAEMFERLVAHFRSRLG
jgi:glycosyltransferase involved in cell wall biosynthesis